MASYYKRIQTVISHGEEDLFHFVDSQNMKNSMYIKKLIREEMIRQAGKGNVPQYTPAPAPQVTEKQPKKEVTKTVEQPPLVDSDKKKPLKSIELDGGGELY